MSSRGDAELVESSVRESIDATESIDVARLLGFSEIIVKALLAGGKVMFCGNGGSASQAQHLAAELVCKFRLKRNPISAIALTTDTSVLTAQSNDVGFDTVFERQVEALGRKGDVLIALSTSGESPNAVRAVKVAKKMSIRTIAFVGADRKCALARSADEVLFVNSSDTPRIQEAHLVAGHILCDLVERKLAAKRGTRSALSV